jgi:hypothetical protein
MSNEGIVMSDREAFISKLQESLDQLESELHDQWKKDYDPHSEGMYDGIGLAQQKLKEASIFTHAMPKSEETAYLSDWVDCPVCGGTDMHKTTDKYGNSLIKCVNHACLSNGGNNYDATPQPTTDISELVGMLDELGEHLRDKDLPSELWKRIKSAISKHTVKA